MKRIHKNIEKKKEKHRKPEETHLTIFTYTLYKIINTVYEGSQQLQYPLSTKLVAKNTQR
jgi:hypothetical protein